MKDDEGPYLIERVCASLRSVVRAQGWAAVAPEVRKVCLRSEKGVDKRETWAFGPLTRFKRRFPRSDTPSFT
jgi:hypothetical protein